MRRMTLVILAGVIALVSLLRADATDNYPLLLYFSMLPIMMAGLLGDKKLLAALVLIPVFCDFLILNFGIERFAVSANICVLGLCAVFSSKLAKLIATQRDDAHTRLEKTSLALGHLKAEQDRAKALNWLKEKHAAEISNLYELTKKMSSEMNLEQIVRVLSDFAATNLKFARAFLFFVSTHEQEPAIKTAYKIGKYGLELGSFEPVRKREQMPNYYERLLTLIQAKGSYVQLPSEVQDGALEKLNLSRDIHDFIAVPVYVKHKIRAILAFENLELKSSERILILADQLSFEVEKADLYAEVQELAIIDGLTGIYVRRHFLERFREELERSIRHSAKLSLLFLDIDHFKQKNDKFGHLVGDAILREVAEILKRNIREIDLVARYGGEEFSLLLTDTAKNDAYMVGERIRSTIEHHTFKAYDETLKITVSMGVSALPEDSKELEGLLEKADIALYKAKARGRNKVCIAGENTV